MEKSLSQISKSTGQLLYYKKGELIYKHGFSAKKIYKIRKGSVKLIKETETGKTLITEIKQPGEYFGFIDVFAEESYHNSAVCMYDAELLSFTKSDIDQILQTEQIGYDCLIKYLARSYNKMEDQLLSMAFSSVRKRIMESLLMLNRKLNEYNTMPFFIHIKRNELAAIAGTVKETTIRTLKDLKEEGLIELKYNGIKLIDIPELQERCRDKVT